jgi:3-methylcrotonyl-CoA carboxylase alpha subunit
MFRKCLIANRGEIAVRILRACRELGVRSVAVYSDADATARHVQLADEAYPLGGTTPAESYLRGAALLDVAARAGCDCVHPGYGFLSENEAFAQAVLDAGLVWIGPPPDAIRRMGVKTEARALMQGAAVPLVPGYQADDLRDDTLDVAAFHAAAERIGYPLMVKAAGGGGGKGIRIVRQPAELTAALEGARNEAIKAFGDARLFMERYIERARHIEIQVLADAHGHTVHLFERECSAQRRHQKVIEESPAPRLAAHTRAAMGAAAVQAAQAVGYTNAGTVEFIVTPDAQFYFLEMNTRLQVEHPITEWVTGVDIVQWQFRIAAGAALPFAQSDLSQRGHAIECRLYAEDAPHGFLPATGPLLTFIPPTGIGVRVDSGVTSGDRITIHYDPMIAKIIVHAPDRAAALARMDQALQSTVLLGTTTNLDFLRALLNHPVFVAGEVYTAFIEAHLSELIPADAPTAPELALIAAAWAESQVTAAAPSAVSAAPSADPWARADGWRLGR